MDASRPRGRVCAVLAVAASLLLLRWLAAENAAPVRPPGIPGVAGPVLAAAASGRVPPAPGRAGPGQDPGTRTGAPAPAFLPSLRPPATAAPGSGGARSGAAPPQARWTNRDGRPASGALDARDLRALADLGAANGLGEASSSLDYDDGDGVLEPHEIGFQIWRDGRLVSLSTGEDRYGSFGYQLRTLPPSLGDLDALEELDLHTNRIAALPDTLGALSRLRVLRVQQNALEGLPAAIGSLAALEELSLGENAITELPPAVGSLAALEELHVNDNPLSRLPDSVGGLSRLRVLNVSHGRAVDPARLGADPGGEADAARLGELPPAVASLEHLETLHLAGNQLFCAGGVSDPALAPPRLRDGSIPRLHGLLAQDCGGPASP